MLVFDLQPDLTTDFLRAARSGNVEKVLIYLDDNININTCNTVSNLVSILIVFLI